MISDLMILIGGGAVGALACIVDMVKPRLAKAVEAVEERLPVVPVVAAVLLLLVCAVIFGLRREE